MARVSVSGWQKTARIGHDSILTRLLLDMIDPLPSFVTCRRFRLATLATQSLLFAGGQQAESRTLQVQGTFVQLSYLLGVGKRSDASHTSRSHSREGVRRPRTLRHRLQRVHW